MTERSAISLLADLELISKAVFSAGALASDYWRRGALKVEEKPDAAGPVSEADLAVNVKLQEILSQARPDYGWLSEESPNDLSRLDRQKVFIVDPIDGTRNFIAGQPTYAICVALANHGIIDAAAVFLPEKKMSFTAAKGQGAWLNGKKLTPEWAVNLSNAKILAAKAALNCENWAAGEPPPFKRHFRGPLAYRLSLIATGSFDAMISLRPTWEWDIAAASLIAQEAGATLSDKAGNILRFNTPAAQTDGIIGAAPNIHKQLLEKLAKHGGKNSK